MRTFNWLGFLLIIIISSSCTTTVQTFVDTSCSNYRSPDFNRNDINEKGISIMPVLGGGDKEAYRRPMGDALAEALRNEFEYENINSTQQVISVLNKNNLTENYANAIEQYNISGIVPRNFVQELGSVLKTGYLLYTKLLADVDISTIYSMKNAKTITIYELSVESQVWDTELGDVVWEGKGGHASHFGTGALVSETAKGLTKVLGEGKSLSCNTTQDLINSIQQSEANQYAAMYVLSTILSIGLVILLL